MFGVDVFETYSPLANMNSTRVVSAVMVAKVYFSIQMDVEKAFLNSNLKEQAHIEVLQRLPATKVMV